VQCNSPDAKLWRRLGPGKYQPKQLVEPYNPLIDTKIPRKSDSWLIWKCAADCDTPGPGQYDSVRFLDRQDSDFSGYSFSRVNSLNRRVPPPGSTASGSSPDINVPSSRSASLSASMSRYTYRSRVNQVTGRDNTNTSNQKNQHYHSTSTPHDEQPSLQPLNVPFNTAIKTTTTTTFPTGGGKHHKVEQILSSHGATQSSHTNAATTASAAAHFSAPSTVYPPPSPPELLSLEVIPDSQWSTESLSSSSRAGSFILKRGGPSDTPEHQQEREREREHKQRKPKQHKKTLGTSMSEHDLRELSMNVAKQVAEASNFIYRPLGRRDARMELRSLSREKASLERLLSPPEKSVLSGRRDRGGGEGGNEARGGDPCQQPTILVPTPPGNNRTTAAAASGKIHDAPSTSATTPATAAASGTSASYARWRGVLSGKKHLSSVLGATDYEQRSLTPTRKQTASTKSPPINLRPRMVKHKNTTSLDDKLNSTNTNNMRTAGLLTPSLFENRRDLKRNKNRYNKIPRDIGEAVKSAMLSTRDARYPDLDCDLPTTGHPRSSGSKMTSRQEIHKITRKNTGEAVKVKGIPGAGKIGRSASRESRDGRYPDLDLVESPTTGHRRGSGSKMTPREDLLAPRNQRIDAWNEKIETESPGPQRRPPRLFKDRPDVNLSSALGGNNTTTTTLTNTHTTRAKSVPLKYTAPPSYGRAEKLLFINRGIEAEAQKEVSASPISVQSIPASTKLRYEITTKDDDYDEFDGMEVSPPRERKEKDKTHRKWVGRTTKPGRYSWVGVLKEGGHEHTTTGARGRRQHRRSGVGAVRSSSSCEKEDEKERLKGFVAEQVRRIDEKAHDSAGGAAGSRSRSQTESKSIVVPHRNVKQHRLSWDPDQYAYSSSAGEMESSQPSVGEHERVGSIKEEHESGQTGGRSRSQPPVFKRPSSLTIVPTFQLHKKHTEKAMKQAQARSPSMLTLPHTNKGLKSNPYLKRFFRSKSTPILRSQHHTSMISKLSENLPNDQDESIHDADKSPEQQWHAVSMGADNHDDGGDSTRALDRDNLTPSRRSRISAVDKKRSEPPILRYDVPVLNLGYNQHRFAAHTPIRTPVRAIDFGFRTKPLDLKRLTLTDLRTKILGPGLSHLT